MGNDLFSNNSIAQSMYESADEILGFSISDISFNGPNETLKQTQFTQPAIFVHSVIVSKLLQDKHVYPSAVAGHSLGEFSALVSAKVLTFEDALHIVKIRSEEMANAGKVSAGSMAAILGADEEQISKICTQDGIVVPANINAPGQVVISGEVDTVKSAIETAKSLGIRRALPLNVSGAFHSPLMKPAREPLSNALNSVNFKDAEVPVYQNVTSKPTQDAGIIKENILKQLEMPVLWSSIILQMKLDGFLNYFEIGPGKVLHGLNRRIIPESTNQSIGSLEQIQNHEQ
jgi:[acyl-carrier-protein] S-malonyltransferase